jgi:hypothetical protein
LDAAGSRLAIHKQCNSCQVSKNKRSNSQWEPNFNGNGFLQLLGSKTLCNFSSVFFPLIKDFKIKMENNDKIGEPTGLLDVKQIGEIADRIALLAGKIEEKGTKEELLECSHNLQQIVKGQ